MTDLLNAKVVSCEKLVVSKTGSPFSVVVQATDTCVGVWLNDKGSDSPLVAIYQTERETCIGLYGPDKDFIALGLTCVAGLPVLQLKKLDGTCLHVTPEQLDELLKK